MTSKSSMNRHSRFGFCFSEVLGRFFVSASKIIGYCIATTSEVLGLFFASASTVLGQFYIRYDNETLAQNFEHLVFKEVFVSPESGKIELVSIKRRDFEEQ